jgi:aromatic-L-amino-acid/L-tryptophan decarboxylase
MAYPLEPDRDEMRAIADRAVTFVVDFISALPDAPASDLDGYEEAVRRVSGDAPEAGTSFAELVDQVALGAAKAFNPAGPGYLAFIPGGGLFAAAIADFMSLSVNRFMNLWNPAPVFAAMENDVIRWLCEIFDYPDGARGILTSGGSMSNFSALVTARTAKLPENFLDGCIYVTDQTHASVAKAAGLAGFPARALRSVPVTPELRMDADALERMVKEDRAAGRTPFCVVASAGTTNTGAADPIAAIADLCQTEGLWLHADAAYGGFFALTERGRALFDGISRADSITLDPHKALFLPYGTGVLLVRNGELLREAHRAKGEYLQDLAPEGDIPNFADYSPELSRDFRGLRVWLPLKLHGLGAFREVLNEKLDLTRVLYEALKSTPGFDLPWEPELTVVPFRYVPTEGDVDAFNQRLLERINASKRVFLSSTRLNGDFWIRACIVSHRTHRDRIDEAISIIQDAARALDHP